MSNLQIPDDIQVLLDCVGSRDDLTLEEMGPLRQWIDRTPGGELALSKSLAQNSRLESALASIEVTVPKTLERKVTSYVRQNMVEEREAKRPRALASQAIERGPVGKGLHYFAGIAVALTAVVLVGYSINRMINRSSSFVVEELALASVDWVETLDENRAWESARAGSYQLPAYLDSSVQVRSVAEFDSEFGLTSAYDLVHTMANVRGVLFVFKSQQAFKHKFIGKDTDFSNSTHHVGIAKDGPVGYVLAVKSSTPSDFRCFINVDHRAPPLALLYRTAWLLC